jgi:hypothetical protein
MTLESPKSESLGSISTPSSILVGCHSRYEFNYLYL